MKAREAWEMRRGIHAARTWGAGASIHLAPRLVRRAYRRELENIGWREVRDLMASEYGMAVTRPLKRDRETRVPKCR